MENYYKSVKKAGRFVNFNSKKRVRRILLDFILWKMRAYNYKKEIIDVPKDFLFPKNKKIFNSFDSFATWIGHSTFLIKSKNINILTDPIWNNSCSPVSFVGPKRKIKAAIDIEKLKNINYVIISHNHYDHLDKNTNIQLYKKFPNIKWIVPIGINRRLKKWGIQNAHSLDWWQNYENDLIDIHSVPSQHYSGRGLFDGNKDLWTGFVINLKKDEKKLYFTGDTGYNDIDFKMIGKKFGSIDLSMISIGAYVPRRFMKPVHLTPEDAIQIHLDVNSKLTIAMHYKTFRLSDENMNQPPYELYLNLKKNDIDPKRFICIEPGEYVNF